MGKEKDEVLAIIEQALQELQFGEVHITIHEGQVVQVHRTEKFRISTS
ncbi:MAG TPA: YezD family protein [Cerasibacillus sp.]|uniref:YezD family protein n=2 Tax=Savagea TaxID=1655429 RepID=A0A8J7KI57_9BACL|nr:YezD family protein [Savagea serpentis]MBF4501958.1 YezD family protein [Savagea serpentis]